MVPEKLCVQYIGRTTPKDIWSFTEDHQIVDIPRKSNAVGSTVPQWLGRTIHPSQNGLRLLCIRVYFAL
jgi:hypothetical protein